MSMSDKYISIGKIHNYVTIQLINRTIDLFMEILSSSHFTLALKSQVR